MSFQNIIISRTDSIGDVVLTLPLAGIIKEHYPNCKLYFLGKTYTEAVIKLSKHVDEFLNWDKIQQSENPINEFKKLDADAIIHVFPNKQIAQIAKQAQIPNRIGTLGRVFHITTCNKKVKFSRKKSDLHEAQLNTKLLQPIGVSHEFSLNELIEHYGLFNPKPLSEELRTQIDKTRFNLILHPKSKGSAKEWGLNNFSELIKILPKEKFKIFVSGTKEEADLINNQLPFEQENVVSLLGKLTLQKYISFINETDGLIAASTGPLHIAAALGKVAIGLYSPKKPIHPGRWQPLGKKASALVYDENCEKCKKGNDCDCIFKISPNTIVDLLMKNNLT